MLVWWLVGGLALAARSHHVDAHDLEQGGAEAPLLGLLVQICRLHPAEGVAGVADHLDDFGRVRRRDGQVVNPLVVAVPVLFHCLERDAQPVRTGADSEGLLLLEHLAEIAFRFASREEELPFVGHGDRHQEVSALAAQEDLGARGGGDTEPAGLAGMFGGRTQGSVAVGDGV